MSTITDFKQFDLGAAAFDAGDDHLLFNCTEDFKEGYKEAYLEWAHGEYPIAAANPDSSHLEEYWDAHYEEATRGMAERLLKAIADKPKRRKIAIQTALAAVFNFILGAAALAAVVLMYLAPLLMDASEVTAFWQGVL